MITMFAARCFSPSLSDRQRRALETFYYPSAKIEINANTLPVDPPDRWSALQSNT